MAEVLEYVLVSTKDLKELIATSEHIYESLERLKEGVDAQNREIARLRKIAESAQEMSIQLKSYKQYIEENPELDYLWDSGDQAALDKYYAARDGEE